MIARGIADENSDGTDPKQQALAHGGNVLGGLLSRLRQPKRTGETADEYRRMSRDEQAARKDVGGFVGARWTADDAGPGP